VPENSLHEETTVMIKLTHQAAILFFKHAGIDWFATCKNASGENCSDRNNPNSTSFEGLLLSTLNGIIAFKQASGCKITITGGTEDGHAGRKSPAGKTHWNGYKLDIRPYPAIEQYIRKHFTKVSRGGDEQWVSKAGNIYTFERKKNHWDITYV
jgi:hypothetical protein